MEKFRRLRLISRHRLFLTLICSYLLLLVPPFLCWAMSNENAVARIAQESKEHTEERLTGSKRLVETCLREIREMAQRIALDARTEALVGLTDLDGQSASFYKVYQYQLMLKEYAAEHLSVGEIFLFLQNNDLIVSSKSATRNAAAQYGHSFAYGAVPYDEFRSLLFARRYGGEFLSAVTVRSLSDAENSVCLFLTVPLFGEGGGALLITLPQSKLLPMFSGIEVGEAGLLLVLDGEGALICSFAGPECPLRAAEMTSRTVLPVGMIQTAVVSEYNQWKYLCVQAEAEAFASVFAARDALVRTLLIALLSGLLTAYALAYWSLTQFRALLRNLFGGRTAEPGNAFYLDQTLNRLTRALPGRAIRASRELLPGEWPFLERLLAGEAAGDGEAVKVLGAVARGENVFAVALLHIEQAYRAEDISPNLLDEIGNINEGAYQLLALKLRDLSSLAGHCAMRSGEIALLLHSARETTLRAEAETGLNAVLQAMEAEVGLGCRAAVGGAYSTPGGIQQSYEEARGALNSFRYVGRSVRTLWPRTDEGPDGCWYPEALETRLLSGLRAGSAAQVQEVFDQLREENLVRRALSPEMGRCLLYALLNTLRRGAVALNELAALEIPSGARLEDSLRELERQMRRLTESAREREAADLGQLSADATDYLRAHFAEPDLTIGAAADALRLTEWQLYRICKEQMNATFAESLERLRIEAACQLLAAGARPGDVGEKVGYRYDSSFRRAFKRVMGSPPGEWAKASEIER